MLTIYSKDNCQQCNMAKMLCDMKGIEYQVKMLDVDYTREDLQALVPSARMFPVIFKGEDVVGSLNELKALLSS